MAIEAFFILLITKIYIYINKKRREVFFPVPLARLVKLGRVPLTQ